MADEMSPEIQEKFRLFLSNNEVFVWDRETVLTLRRKYRIIGSLVGSVASKPRQNIVFSLPLVLQAEEVSLLLEKNIAELVVNDSTHSLSSKNTVKTFQEDRKENINEQIKKLREIKKKKLEEFAEVIEEARERKREKIENRKRKLLSSGKHEPKKQRCAEESEYEKIHEVNNESCQLSSKMIHESISTPPEHNDQGNLEDSNKEEECEEKGEQHGHKGDNDGHKGDNEGHNGDNEGHKGDNEGHNEDNEGHNGDNEGHNGDNEGHNGDNEGHKGDNDGHKRDNEGHKGDNECHKGDTEVHKGDNEGHNGDNKGDNEGHKGHKGDTEVHKRDNEGHNGDNEVHKPKTFVNDSQVNLEDSTLVCVPSQHPPSLLRMEEAEWTFPETEDEKLRYKVFLDLWERGYYITQGGKFGGDYLVYPGDPLRFHSYFVVVIVPWKKNIHSLDLVSVGRLGSTVKKTSVMVSLDCAGNVIYTSVQWPGFT